MIKILIISNDLVFLTALKRLLITQLPSVRLKEADGGEALTKIRTFKPALIFTDIKLTGENGFELTERIKSLFPEIIIIILMDYDVLEYYEAAKQVGADYCLSKQSTSAVEILDLVKSILPGLKT